jgi:hypothetical protein
MFVIDGAMALRAAIEEVFGSDQPVQRCRNHKIRNVLDELPEEQQRQALNLLRAAWKVKPPKRVRNVWSNWPGLWNATTNQPRATGKTCQRCSRSSGCNFLLRCTSAWPQPTLLRARKAAFRSDEQRHALA